MIKTVLFDVDGVLLSEERYFDASALTVWEILYSQNYLALNPEKYKVNYTDSEIENIRACVFENDLVLKFQKSCGLNANWDMIYITVAYQLIRFLEQIKESEQVAKWVSKEIDRTVLQEIGKALAEKEIQLDFAALLDDFKQAERTKEGLFSHLDFLAKEKLGVEKTVFGEIGELWSTCEHVSQEWYVGDQHVLASTGRPSVQTGKEGFLSSEKVLAPAADISELFDSLKKAGVTIGIGTGRPELETIEPFKYLGWLTHFDVNYIVTADDVLNAERSIPEMTGLSKPNPFTYVKALSGKTKTDLECIKEKMPIPKGKETLVVGDSFADLLAARKMGCTFAAVLTGLSGKDAREEFEKHNADYILDSVLDIKDLVLSLVK
ncbi:HAD family hydrolase [Bacillus sp. FJAT-49711]|uniref:HAD family hydrolase n=1 Tax=Bacillus sp. FJAT-49711 TaxID=2833585 RepID=UPI001BCA62AA|nr:HAD family hydrolase [Bacillus sp. FJAT-49711]MBS4220403.1 HAD family hydrolase [Bacillus sp. FJAT-49711]